MRQFILLFLFIAYVGAADDALLETENGPKSSADLVAEAGEPNAAAIDKIPLGAAVGTTVIKDDAKAEAVATDVKKAEAVEEKNKSKSSESTESKEEEAEDKKVKVEAIPKETVAVAHKKAGDEKPEVATATKVELKPVETEARAKRDEEAIDKIPLGAAVGTTVVKDEAKVVKDADEKSAAENKSKSSESKESKEKEEEVETEKVKLSKVPTEEVAVAHKKAGEDEVKISTATEAAIVAEKVEKSRARRFA
jgi:hypothetical protein|uniref:Uncharacterized protein n=1 Tax=Panagrolaimus sp. PS1159 TaxID=55785 RepID=A0AC35G039_9BILA